MKSVDTVGLLPSSLSPGDHLCCVFDDEAQRQGLLLRLIREGLRRAEKVCCLHDSDRPPAWPDCEDAPPAGQLVWRSLNDPSPLLDWIEQQAAGALAEGCRALRVIGEFQRAAGLPPGGLALLEQRLSDLCGVQYLAAACLVDSRQGQPGLGEALLCHPRLALGETSRANPFYLPPGLPARAALEQHLLSAEMPTGELRLRLSAETTRRQAAEQALEQARAQLREYEASLASGATARRRSDQALRLSQAQLRQHEAQFRSLVEFSPVGISLTDEQGLVIEWNACAQQIYQIPPERILGRPIWEVRFETLPDDQRSPARLAQLKESYENFFRTGQAPWLHQYEDRSLRWPDGDVRYVQRIRFPIRTERGFMVASIMRDVTAHRKTELELEHYRQRLEAMVEQRTLELRQQVREREQVEDVLRESEGRYRALVNQSPLSILVEQAGHYVFANPTIVQRLGYDSAYELVGRASADIVAPAEHLPVSPRQTGSNQSIRGFFRKDGSVYFAEVTSVAIFYQGRPAMLIIGQDVTERLQYEQRLETSLAEKEVMLREIHHRVKNNLNVIIALIDLQKATQTDAQVLQVFKELQTRAYTMSLVHESLYRTPNLAQVDFAGYLQTLVSHLYSAYGPPAGMGSSAGYVDVRVEARDVALNIETAIPCGLIVNELVTNALKYGFPGQTEKAAFTESRVTVRLERQPAAGGGELVLTVQDNGAGLPPGLDWRNTQTLGMQLVQILTRQLGGKIELVSGSGVTWRLTFLERKVQAAL